MKKLLAILMALVMCCSLVVSASAVEYDGDLFYMDVALDGEWYEYDSYEVDFDTEDSAIYVCVYTEYDCDGDLLGAFEEIYYEAISYSEEEPEYYYFSEFEISGCDAICLDSYDENGDIYESEVYVLTQNYIYEIEIWSEESYGEYDALWEAVLSMEIYDDSYAVDYEDDYVEDDYEDDYVEDDYEEEEIVEEEEDEEKPSKDDKDDKDDKKDKEDKEDKDNDEDEDEDKDNTTLIIIIVAGVAVVAIAAVVIVLVTKKKK